ncbi:MAG: hypothetical protein PF448_10045 [Bacteroidales bacterium]|jgi:hypothetical protein|nr:hypothetical protein [Bacteroidales bacterium]
MKTAKDWIKQLKTDVKQTWAFPLLVGIGVFLHFWLNNFSFELTDFQNRVFGISTLHQIDVGARISAFYKAIFLGFGIFILLKIAYTLFVQRFKSFTTEISSIHYLSITGLFLFGFSIFGMEIYASRLLIEVLLIFILIVIPVKSRLKLTKIRSANDYFWLFITAYSITIMGAILSGKLPFGQFAFSFAAVLILLFSSIHVFKLSPVKTFFHLRKLVYFPLLFVISQEIYLIFNQHNIGFIHPLITASVLLLIFGIIQITFQKKQADYTHLNRRILSGFVLSLIVFSTYSIQLVLRNDLFEIANSSNALMSIFQHGKFPVADFLPTHLLSDFFLPVIYTIFNGYDSSFSYMAYNFIMMSAYFYLSFLIVLKLSRNHYIALLSLLFFPFFNATFWGISSFPILIVPLVINQLYNYPNQKSWFALAVLSVFLLGWKPDVAILGIYGLLAGIIIIRINKRGKLKWKHALKAFSIIYAALVLFLLSLEFIFKVPVKEGISNTLNFFASSPQGRGLPVIAYQFDRIFYLHHVLYPILIAIALILGLKQIKRMNSYNAMPIIALIIFSIFYFTNIQRGLTRHSFAEGHDGFISSFAIISIALVFFLFRMKRIHRIIGFFISISIMAIMFKYPTQASDYMVFDQVQKKIKSNYLYSGNERIQRVSFNPDYYQKNIRELLNFTNQIPDSAGFYDFSNTPASYYLTKREMPVYFIHSLAITSEKIQEIEIENLKSHNVPFVIFSHIPETYWDKTDGIHNALRFYKISEYLYRNYSPYKLVGNYAIWKANNYQAETDLSHYSVDTISEKPRIFEMKKLPLIWAKYDTKFSSNNVEKSLLRTGAGKEIRFDATIDKSQGNYILINIENPKKIQGKAKLRYFETWEQFGEFSFDISQESINAQYLIRISSQWNWYNKSINRIVIVNPESTEVKQISILKAD